jgi:hypothetical protein
MLGFELEIDLDTSERLEPRSRCLDRDDTQGSRLSQRKLQSPTAVVIGDLGCRARQILASALDALQHVRLSLT